MCERVFLCMWVLFMLICVCMCLCACGYLSMRVPNRSMYTHLEIFQNKSWRWSHLFFQITPPVSVRIVDFLATSESVSGFLNIKPPTNQCTTWIPFPTFPRSLVVRLSQSYTTLIVHVLTVPHSLCFSMWFFFYSQIKTGLWNKGFILLLVRTDVSHYYDANADAEAEADYSHESN